MERVLKAAAPEEGCALLIGSAPSAVCWHVLWVWPCLNVWEPSSERPRRFAVDPREQLLAQKWARARHGLVLGAAHSHPDGMPVPSALDLRLTFPPTLMAILGRSAGREEAGSWQLVCWWIPEAAAGVTGNPPPHPRRLAWKMAD